MNVELYIFSKPPVGWSASIEGHFIAGSPPSLRTPTYGSWYNMIKRCYYVKENNQKYLQKGTKVCIRWISGDGIKCGFLCFLEDMGERPINLTLDRIDVDGHYTPDNCRWADDLTQARNRSKHA